MGWSGGSGRGGELVLSEDPIPLPETAVADLAWANKILRAVCTDPGFHRPASADSYTVLRSDIDQASARDNAWQRHCLDLIDRINGTFTSDHITIGSDLSRYLNALNCDNALKMKSFIETGLLKVTRNPDTDIDFRDGYYVLPDGDRYGCLVQTLGRRAPVDANNLARHPRVHRLGVEDRQLPVVNGVHIISGAAVAAVGSILQLR